MAPKRKAGQSTVAKVAAAPSRETRSAARITRSSAKNSSVNFIELPDTRKIKKSTNKKQKIAEVKGKGKAIAKEDSASEDGKDEEEASENVLEDSSKPVVIIEHCKQCKSFERRAIEVKEGLEKSDVDVILKLNPEKPRRGCFEIRQDGGKVFVSLLGMKRPFKPMKDLNMDKVISDIIAGLSNSS
ncbi:selenoprotein H [Trifolium repens]|nr:selenoprotein H [Trifolium repens]